MRFRLLIVFLILSAFTHHLYPQSVNYFIKFRDFVSKDQVKEKLDTKKLLSNTNNSLYKSENISANYLAKGFSKNLGDLFRIIKITFESEQQAQIFINDANNDPSIEYFQKENVYKIDFTPNDSLIAEQWGLEKIQAFNAWDITQGSDTVLIGVIDTGIDFEHPDLTSQIFYNPGENGVDSFGKDKQSNGIDDDNNGFVDDYMGWDFTDRVGFPFDSTGGDYLSWDNNPMDEQGHGTYIAGIAGAAINNRFGIAGVAPKSKIINIRAFDPTGYGEEDDVAAALLYAVKMKAKVVNMSFGDNAFSYVLRDVIRYAYSQGVVLIASSGNSGSDSPHYPSGYSEVICVGNSNSDDGVAGSSNFGSTTDLVAPGSLITTTAVGNNYSVISGTSASAPFVSGAAALILSLGNFTNEEIKQILKSTTDDINTSGWDLRSGAGRLNVFRAVSVVAPAVIKINHPTQDFSTIENNLNVNATILSPYFTKYELYYGIGLNPIGWNTLITNGLNQFSNKNIYSLDISAFSDTVYTLRLVVYQNNGRTLEERVNFYVDRSPPTGALISVGPAFYGNRTTILAALQSNEPSVARLFYRKKGEGNYNFITLDGFASNNQFTRQLHYGFVPKHLIEENSIYEIYFEVENLVGLKSTITINNDSIFAVSAGFNTVLSSENILPYKLNKGSIYKNPTNFLSQNFDEVLYSEFYPSPDLVYGLYKLSGNDLVKIDSITNRIPRDVGDFNANGKIDLLSSIQRNGFIDEQSVNGTFSFSNKYSDESGTFWPILARDIDSDGKTEILVVNSETSITVWKVHSTLELYNSTKLANFSPVGAGGNEIDAPNALVCDTDNDGKNEIWVADRDGDLYSYIIQNPNSFVQDKIISTEFLASAALLDAGDYDGDGFQDIAVLLHSIESLDIAPFYKLEIISLSSGSPKILYDQAFIDASSEFNNSFRSAESSIRFADLDADGKDELIVFVFPYSYIFKSSAQQNQIISYKENVNSSSIFVGDLNKNGVKEVAFPTNEGIKFSEFIISNKATTPFDLMGYSLDTTQVFLRWTGLGEKFYIYRGEVRTNVVLIDSTLNTKYYDSNILNNRFYYYSIKASDQTKPDPISDFSQIVEVYSHETAKIDSIISTSSSSISVYFSEKISNTIDNLASFRLINVGIPNSISPQGQKSLLLTFDSELPIGNNQLIISNINDFYGSPIMTDTVTFKVDPTIIFDEQFFISSHLLLTPYKLKVSFNLELDEISALNTINYIFNPSIIIKSIELDPTDKKSIYISWENQKPVGAVGKEYVLKINNLRSSASTGNLEIASGAGSSIVLVGYAKDLSDVYVYPQPGKVENGSGKITFANLPLKAKIIIFNLEGKQIKSIEENNGDGGIDVVLRDNNGDVLNSGIYLYRIVRLDDNGNEAEEKIGKFAIIK